MSQTFKYSIPEYGYENETIEAEYSHRAAEKAVEKLEWDGVSFQVASGMQTVEVIIHTEEGDKTFVVSGESVPTYNARLKQTKEQKT